MEWIMSFEFRSTIINFTNLSSAKNNFVLKINFFIIYRYISYFLTHYYYSINSLFQYGTELFFHPYILIFDNNEVLDNINDN